MYLLSIQKKFNYKYVSKNQTLIVFYLTKMKNKMIKKSEDIRHLILIDIKKINYNFILTQIQSKHDNHAYPQHAMPEYIVDDVLPLLPEYLHPN